MQLFSLVSCAILLSSYTLARPIVERQDDTPAPVPSDPSNPATESSDPTDPASEPAPEPLPEPQPDPAPEDDGCGEGDDPTTDTVMQYTLEVTTKLGGSYHVLPSGQVWDDLSAEMPNGGNMPLPPQPEQPAGQFTVEPMGGFTGEEDDLLVELISVDSGGKCVLTGDKVTLDCSQAPGATPTDPKSRAGIFRLIKYEDKLELLGGYHSWSWDDAKGEATHPLSVVASSYGEQVQVFLKEAGAQAPTDPVPQDPTDPPTDPTDPPADPTDPPTDPTDPPADPTDPSGDPNAPTDPQVPADPTGPTDPSTPTDPDTPVDAPAPGSEDEPLPADPTTGDSPPEDPHGSTDTPAPGDGEEPLPSDPLPSTKPAHGTGTASLPENSLPTPPSQ